MVSNPRVRDHLNHLPVGIVGPLERFLEEHALPSAADVDSDISVRGRMIYGELGIYQMVQEVFVSHQKIHIEICESGECFLPMNTQDHRYSVVDDNILASLLVWIEFDADVTAKFFLIAKFTFENLCIRGIIVKLRPRFLTTNLPHRLNMACSLFM